jgi:hypothetical protein
VTLHAFLRRFFGVDATNASTSRDIDRLARGPSPQERVGVPQRGERCPRCHRGVGNGQPCLLCAPHLVPGVRS